MQGKKNARKKKCRKKKMQKEKKNAKIHTLNHDPEKNCIFFFIAFFFSDFFLGFFFSVFFVAFCHPLHFFVPCNFFLPNCIFFFFKLHFFFQIAFFFSSKLLFFFHGKKNATFSSQGQGRSMWWKKNACTPCPLPQMLIFNSPLSKMFHHYFQKRFHNI